MDRIDTPPFYVGETVEYITGISMPKGTKVIVKGLFRFPCGCWMIDIGSPFNRSKYNNSLCDVCDCRVPVLPFMHWDCKSFRSLRRLPSLTFTKMREEKPEILQPN